MKYRFKAEVVLSNAYRMVIDKGLVILLSNNFSDLNRKDFLVVEEYEKVDHFELDDHKIASFMEVLHRGVCFSFLEWLEFYRYFTRLYDSERRRISIPTIHRKNETGLIKFDDVQVRDEWGFLRITEIVRDGCDHITYSLTCRVVDLEVLHDVVLKHFDRANANLSIIGGKIKK